MKETIAQEGEAVLRHKAKPVLKKDITSPKIRRIISHMKKALAAEHYGVAIAAPQIGESLRIFVISGRALTADKDDEDEDDFENTPRPTDLVFINPEITRLSRAKKEMSEGCLSVRGKYGSVIRHEKASVKAFNEKGEAFTYNGTGLVGHIFQHEHDHLEGILYIDKAKKLTDDPTFNQRKHE